MTTTTTTEQYVHGVRDLVIEHGKLSGVLTDEQADRLAHVKLLYGVGDGSYRGVCIYNAWENGVGRVDVVEIAATGQESWVQLAGTVIHELGHVLAGHGAGHGVEWKDQAKALGFVKRPAAAGQHYSLALINPWLRERIYLLARRLGDGNPAFRTIGLGALGIIGTPGACSAGVGTKGGKSRGKGSGSRLIKIECRACSEAGDPYVARMSQKTIDRGTPLCPEHGEPLEVA